MATIQIASDLHLEARSAYRATSSVFVPAEDRDLLVLAGDIGVGNGARWFVERELRRSPVIYVPGNHEYYGLAPRLAVDGEWRRFAEKNHDFFYLIDESAEVAGLRIYGTPLWSGFDGAKATEPFRWAIMDFARNPAWTPWHHRKRHKEAVEKLKENGMTADLVVTHWPPTWGAVAEEFAGHPLNHYFYANLDALVEKCAAKLWIAGHTHHPFDYEVGGTRVVGNPTGYPSEGLAPGFRPDFVVHV